MSWHEMSSSRDLMTYQDSSWHAIGCRDILLSSIIVHQSNTNIQPSVAAHLLYAFCWPKNRNVFVSKASVLVATAWISLEAMKKSMTSLFKRHFLSFLPTVPLEKKHQRCQGKVFKKTTKILVRPQLGLPLESLHSGTKIAFYEYHFAREHDSGALRSNFR